MAHNTEIVVTLPGGRRVDAEIPGHRIKTDQAREDGGDDSAPRPFQLFLASIGTCAGIFVQGFCAKRKLPTEGIRIIERPQFAENGTLVAVDLDIEVPPSFPEKYRDALVRVADQCSVKKAILTPPRFGTRTVVRARLP